VSDEWRKVGFRPASLLDSPDLTQSIADAGATSSSPDSEAWILTSESKVSALVDTLRSIANAKGIKAVISTQRKLD
jgi:hypothetical protein